MRGPDGAPAPVPPVTVTLVELGELPRELGPAVLAALPAPLRAGDLQRRVFRAPPSFDARRGQVDASGLLQLLPVPAPGCLVLGLTTWDLFLPALAYVFGLSELGQRRGVLSWARLRPDPIGATPLLLERRVQIEAVHELGHAIGLIHCLVSHCPMHRTLWPEAVELKQRDYCPSCRAKIDELLVQRVSAVPGSP